MKRRMNKNFESWIVNRGECLVKNNHRAVKRIEDIRKSSRKRKLAKNIYGADWYKHFHQYSKGKIHCSCWLCCFKGLTKADRNKLISMKQEIDELNAILANSSNTISNSLQDFDKIPEEITFDSYDDDKYYQDWLEEKYYEESLSFYDFDDDWDDWGFNHDYQCDHDMRAYYDFMEGICEVV